LPAFEIRKFGLYAFSDTQIKVLVYNLGFGLHKYRHDCVWKWSNVRFSWDTIAKYIIIIIDSEESACVRLVKNPMPTHLHTSMFLTQHFYCMMSFNWKYWVLSSLAQ